MRTKKEIELELEDNKDYLRSCESNLRNCESSVSFYQNRVRELEKELELKNHRAMIGDVYLIKGYEYLICSTRGNWAATIIKGNSQWNSSGCWTSVVGAMDCKDGDDLQRLLDKKGAEYLGRFTDLYERKNV